MNNSKNKKKKKQNPIDAWVEANFEKLMLTPGIQKLFKIKDEKVLDFVSRELEDEERVKGDSLKGLEPFKTRYTEKDIKELAKTLNWNGKGIENNPIIIESIDGLPQKFSLTVDLHIKIKNCTFDHVILHNCQNISIEHCSFDNLGILKSSKIRIKSSTLSNLNLEYSNNNYFKECSIAKAYNLRSQANIFEDCTMTNEVRDLLLKELSGLLKFLKQLPWIILVTGCGIAIFTFLNIFNSTPFGLYWYLSILTFIGLIILYILLLRYQRKLPPNKVKSNTNLK